jgi:hypothetical protein
MAGRRSNGEGSLRRMRSRNLCQYRWTERVDGGSVRRSGLSCWIGLGGAQHPAGEALLGIGYGEQVRGFAAP